MKIKKLCDLHKKDIEKHKDEIVQILRKPTYVCRNCCRVANDKRHLCKPEKLHHE